MNMSLIMNTLYSLMTWNGKNATEWCQLIFLHLLTKNYVADEILFSASYPIIQALSSVN
jgi:hypothetical protein